MFTAVRIPYWFLILGTVVVAFVPKIPWARRFSLRTLLIIVTLACLGCGIVAISR
jgi:hypothetical protein